jgi:glucosamine-phosphate N-acetyltransferase
MAKGYLDLLAYLSKVGRVTEEQWRRRFASMFAFEPPKYYVVVVEDTRAARVVATATLMVEFKFLRSCGEAGHVEDVVVDPAYRGKHLGLVVVAELLRVAAARGLYKVILNCNDRNVPFYEKLGFVRKDNQMAIYREPRDAT